MGQEAAQAPQLIRRHEVRESFKASLLTGHWKACLEVVAAEVEGLEGVGGEEEEEEEEDGDGVSVRTERDFQFDSPAAALTKFFFFFLPDRQHEATAPPPSQGMFDL